MGEYSTIHCGRSDGRQSLGQGRGLEINEPTPEQLDGTPDEKGVVDYYKKLSNDDTKSLDWRRKLAGMLTNALGGPAVVGGKSCILAALPENYVLYEHQKYTISEEHKHREGIQRRASKAPNDRQDAYLYGHPLGRRKRFRSPSDFFPHLLWLMTDTENDGGNCTCKVCQPEDVNFPAARLEAVRATAEKERAEKERAEGEKVEREKAEKAEKNMADRGRSASQVSSEPLKPSPKKTMIGSLPRPASNLAGSTSVRPKMEPSAPLAKKLNPTTKPLAGTTTALNKKVSVGKSTTIASPSDQTSIPPMKNIGHTPAQSLGTLQSTIGAAASGVKTQATQPRKRLPGATQAKAPTGPLPSHLPTPVNREHSLDLLPDKYLYRIGELVWFSRGASWGLSVITKRALSGVQAPPGPHPHPHYLINPLSHPLHHHPPQIVSSEHLLRPWLAWSVPSPTNAFLANSSITYDTANWPDLLAGHYGPGDLDVDGSILAARALDRSYTALYPLPSPSTPPTPAESLHAALYLGGEKIWLGDAVRLRSATGQAEILIVQRIASARAGPLQMSLVGDAYEWALVAADKGGVVSDQSRLPPRVKADMDFRNETAAKAGVEERWHWKLGTVGKRVALGDVRGRWYESRVLGPIVKGEAWNEEVSSGRVEDVCKSMNERCRDEIAVVEQDRAGVWKESRKVALGRSVGDDWTEGREGDVIDMSAGNTRPEAREVPLHTDGAMDLS